MTKQYIITRLARDDGVGVDRSVCVERILQLAAKPPAAQEGYAAGSGSLAMAVGLAVAGASGLAGHAARRWGQQVIGAARRPEATSGRSLDR